MSHDPRKTNRVKIGQQLTELRIFKGFSHAAWDQRCFPQDGRRMGTSGPIETSIPRSI